MKTHCLKILPKYFCEVIAGRKNFELRENDRDFGVGDYIKLNEWENGKYTGLRITVLIEYILYEYDDVLKKDWVIISFKKIHKGVNTFPISELEGGNNMEKIITYEGKYLENGLEIYTIFINNVELFDFHLDRKTKKVLIQGKEEIRMIFGLKEYKDYEDFLENIDFGTNSFELNWF